MRDGERRNVDDGEREKLVVAGRVVTTRIFRDGGGGRGESTRKVGKNNTKAWDKPT